MPHVSKAVIVHVFLGLFTIMLGYIVLGLILDYNPSADAFFGLSFLLLFFAIAQALYEIGLKNTVAFALTTSLIGFGFEILGTNTGLPFGSYYYTDFLGPKVLGVPVVVPLIWFVITYITFSQCFPLLQGATKSRILGIIAVASFGAVAWDLMVDPMFSTYGYWVWQKNSSGLVPALSGVPITNFAGWFVVVFLMIFLYLVLFSKRGNMTGLKRRENVVDSRIVYALLLVDGAVANWSLGHYMVVGIGAFTMIVFIFASYFILERSRKIESNKIVSKGVVK